MAEQGIQTDVCSPDGSRAAVLVAPDSEAFSFLPCSSCPCCGVPCESNQMKTLKLFTLKVRSMESIVRDVLVQWSLLSHPVFFCAACSEPLGSAGLLLCPSVRACGTALVVSRAKKGDLWQNNKKVGRLYLLVIMVTTCGVLTGSGGAGEAVRLPGKLNGEVG